MPSPGKDGLLSTFLPDAVLMTSMKSKLKNSRNTHMISPLLDPEKILNVIKIECHVANYAQNPSLLTIRNLLARDTSQGIDKSNI